jgi:pimeloyl-ACP methyl ester carboxylesterase
VNGVASRGTVRRRLATWIGVGLVLGASGCTTDVETSTTTTATTSPVTPATSATTSLPVAPLPSPIKVRQEPEGVSLADPAFEALPGARAEFGRLGGAVYQFEVPLRWNGRLVLWMHGFEDFRPEAAVSAPDVRAYLIAQGYAWGASSFSSTSWIPGRASDETAALWDHFVASHGRPDRTYVIGLSMGGAAGHIAAERHADRFDGVLALCGAAGATPALTDGANQFVAAAYAAGLTQADFDASADIGALIRDRIRPALVDPARRDRFERIMVELTGGARPFDREGLRAAEETNWRRLEAAVAAGVIPRRAAPYRLGPLSDVSAAKFNRGAIRLRTNDALLDQFVAGNEVTGALRMPLITLHTTGDGQVPIEQARILRRRVDAAEAGELLVQRVVRDPGHCGFTTTEWVASLEALVRWVEDGITPDGNDVLVDDLSVLPTNFELQPRAGTPDADTVPGAADRVVVRGTATLDGAPLRADFLGATVLDRGLMAACQHALSPVTDGEFELTVMADTEAAGCGAPGAQIVLWTFAGGTQFYAVDSLPWPGNGASRAVDLAFSTATPEGLVPSASSFAGEVVGPDGRYVRPGTRIEAYAGSTLCGVASTRRTGSFSGYTLFVVGVDAVDGCARGAKLTFRVDGQRATQTAVHEPGRSQSPFDLTVR